MKKKEMAALFDELGETACKSRVMAFEEAAEADGATVLAHILRLAIDVAAERSK